MAARAANAGQHARAAGDQPWPGQRRPRAQPGPSRCCAGTGSFSALLAAGLVLRVLAQAAYQPALIYIDTLKYLYGASPGSEPLGYTGYSGPS